jgi:hypothetical protein
MESHVHVSLMCPSRVPVSEGIEEPHLRRRTVAPQVGLKLPDALGISHEGEGVKVHAHVDAEVDVLPVLVCDGRQVG